VPLLSRGSIERHVKHSGELLCAPKVFAEYSAEGGLEPAGVRAPGTQACGARCLAPGASVAKLLRQSRLCWPSRRRWFSLTLAESARLRTASPCRRFFRNGGG
jgi:hypothetical protein